MTMKTQVGYGPKMNIRIHAWCVYTRGSMPGNRDGKQHQEKAGAQIERSVKSAAMVSSPDLCT